MIKLSTINRYLRPLCIALVVAIEPSGVELFLWGVRDLEKWARAKLKGNTYAD